MEVFALTYFNPHSTVLTLKGITWTRICNNILIRQCLHICKEQI